MDSKRKVRIIGDTSMNVEHGEGIGKDYNGHEKMPSEVIKQWDSILRATKVVNKFKANISKKPGSGDDPASQGYPASKDDPASQDDSASQCDPASQLEYLIAVHRALVNQFNTYGIILTLVVAVTSVAILQPPSSLNEGHMSASKLVACYLMFSTLSFLLAFTGLMAVIVGSASLFRPCYFNKSEMIAWAGQGIKNGTVVYDDIQTLRNNLHDNLLRVRRLTVYLALSSWLGMLAFVCGASAILGPVSRNRYMAIATIIASGFVLIFETVMTLYGPTESPRWLRRILKKDVGSGRNDSVFDKSTSETLRNPKNRDIRPGIKQGLSV